MESVSAGEKKEPILGLMMIYYQVLFFELNRILEMAKLFFLARQSPTSLKSNKAFGG
jgi:hypothetical protein